MSGSNTINVHARISEILAAPELVGHNPHTSARGKLAHYLANSTAMPAALARALISGVSGNTEARTQARLRAILGSPEAGSAALREQRAFVEYLALSTDIPSTEATALIATFLGRAKNQTPAAKALTGAAPATAVAPRIATEPPLIDVDAIYQRRNTIARGDIEKDECVGFGGRPPTYSEAVYHRREQDRRAAIARSTLSSTAIGQSRP